MVWSADIYPERVEREREERSLLSDFLPPSHTLFFFSFPFFLTGVCTW